MYEWYGGVNLFLTLVSDGLMVAGCVMATTSEGQMDTTAGLMVAGLSSHALSGPLTHLFEGNTGRALGSLALRTALPVLVGLAGGGIGEGELDDDIRTFGATAGAVWGAAIGFGIGLLVGQIIDVFAMARDPGEPES